MNTETHDQVVEEVIEWLVYGPATIIELKRAVSMSVKLDELSSIIGEMERAGDIIAERAPMAITKFSLPPEPEPEDDGGPQAWPGVWNEDGWGDRGDR